MFEFGFLLCPIVCLYARPSADEKEQLQSSNKQKKQKNKNTKKQIQ